MNLSIEFREEEWQKWNRAHGLEEWDEMDLDEVIFGIISDKVKVLDVFWGEGYPEWFGNIYTVDFEIEIEDNIKNNVLDYIKSTLLNKENIEVYKISINKY